VNGPFARRIFVDELGAKESSLQNSIPSPDFGGYIIILLLYCKFPSNFSKVSKFPYILCWNFIFFEKFDGNLQYYYYINIL
jgi:hypothetical protein